MHNAALAYLVKDGHEKLKEWRYFKFDIDLGDLNEAADLLFKKKFLGTNLTVPHKVAGLTIAFASSEALRIGAVNTLDKNQAGGWKAHNTDGYGLSQVLKRDLGVDLRGASIVLLGAGGAARAAATQCLDEGCAKLWIGNRDRSRLEALIKHLNAGDRVNGFFLDAPKTEQWPEDVLVINATTVGINAEDQEPSKIQLFLTQKARIFDMTFQRENTTRFVTVAKNNGRRATDGLGMLVWQGAKSLSIWLQSQAALNIQPEALAPTMMTAACKALGRSNPNA
jgi:shikimate dehydrogenase